MNTVQIDEPHHVQQVAPNWFRGFLQGKTRILLAWFFPIILLGLARQYPAWPGVALCFIGSSIRMWASGFLRKDARPAVGGPYAFVRNPLYLGTYLMAVGVAWSIGNLGLLAVVTIAFALVYHFIILDEETKLEKIFGQSYLLYCKAVPRFFPRLWPPLMPAQSSELQAVNPEPAHRVYDWALAKRNKWWEPHLSFVGLIAAVTLAAWVWQHFTRA